jgi:hypothetical protein
MLQSLNAYSGDKIIANVKVDNNSGRSVSSIKCKLKQTWTFGEGFYEKSSVFKVKHKDHSFPLDKGLHNISIPIIVPDLGLRPTIQVVSISC